MAKSEPVDVLIVGGGVIGLACAHYLAEAGRSVRLLERSKIGSGASYGNCGLVFVSDLVPLCVPGAVRSEIAGVLRRTSPLFIRPTLDIERISWLLKFVARCRSAHVRHAVQARESILGSSERLYEGLFRDGGLEAERERRGVLLVYRSEAAMQSYEKVNAWLRPYGLQAEPLVGRALLQKEPALGPEVVGAWYHRLDSHLNPAALLASWTRHLRAKGVLIEEDCGLSRLGVSAGRVKTAVTAKGEFAARDFVLAAGAWSAPIAAQLRLKLPIQPGKGYSITMARPARCPAIPCYLYERRVVATPWPSGYRLGGTMEFSGFSDALSAGRLEALRCAAGEYLLEPLGSPEVETWTGLRPMTYDDLPVIGRAPGFENLLLATGHGMLGVTTAPATGKLVAEMVCGEPPHIDPRPFSAGRFH
jgi:D-amino-acid dehydrogenase